MHCEWRLHRQFIMWCAEQVGNSQVIEDPNVSVFNVHRFFFLNVLTRACAEYINFVAGLPGAEDLSDPEAFLAKAEANRDFAWVCHFAFDAGFFVLQCNRTGERCWSAGPQAWHWALECHRFGGTGWNCGTPVPAHSWYWVRLGTGVPTGSLVEPSLR